MEDWWRTERRRQFTQDPGVPAYPWDATGRPSPCPWAFALSAPTNPAHFDWARCFETLKAVLRRKR